MFYFDYFSANLICLFIRKLDLNLYLRNLDLEEVISKYDVDISIHSNFNLCNKLNTDYDLCLSLKNQTVFQITDNMIEHPNKSDIKKNELYQLAETLSFRLANNYQCSLFSVNNNIENNLKGIFLDDIIIFKISLEK